MISAIQPIAGNTLLVKLRHQCHVFPIFLHILILFFITAITQSTHDLPVTSFLFSISHPPTFSTRWAYFLNILQIFLPPVKTYFKTSKKSHRFHTFPSIPAAFPHTHGEMSPDFLLKMHRFFFVFFRKCVRVIPYANTSRNLSISVSASFVYNGGFYFGNCRKRT